MKIKTKDLLGASLDWAVCAALEKQFNEARVVKICRVEATTPAWIEVENGPGRYAYHRFGPSTDRDQGFEIIEREGIAIRKHTVSGNWYAMTSDDLGNGTIARWDEMTARGGERYGPESYAVRKRQQRFDGATPLIAAMRCYVASQLGAEVEVPDQLVG